ncbi:hypothetical protein B0H14DRAFT_2573385 [Mycena olivaceomarginata]|nr:hypothetical protein B0H14DRAFT_2573385 [Mycena olivaceomarginata]
MPNLRAHVSRPPFPPAVPARISQRYEIPYTHDIRHPSHPAGIPPTIRMLNPRARIFENGGSRAARRAGRRAGGAMRAGGARACGLSPPQERELGGMQGQGVTWSLHSDRHGGTGGQRALHKEIQRAAATRFRAAAVIWRVGARKCARTFPPQRSGPAFCRERAARTTARGQRRCCFAAVCTTPRRTHPRRPSAKATEVAQHSSSLQSGDLGHHPASIAPMQAKMFLRRLGSEIGERKAPEADVASAEKEASLKAAVDRR